jgi:phosphatidylserine/phosphatidylglycerophosphate/cardiolipin synthase-like enzyme
MQKIFLFFLFCSWPWISSAQDIQVYFSPNGGCERAVISEIKKATQTIDIAMYYLSSGDIARALAGAKENNVRIRIVLDEGQEVEKPSKAGYLVKHGMEVRYHMGFGLMHNKFTVIDGKTLITGSFNWTRTAEERNEENMLILTDGPTVKKYEDRFEYLWKTSRVDSRNAKGVEAVPSWFCTTFHLCAN